MEKPAHEKLCHLSKITQEDTGIAESTLLRDAQASCLQLWTLVIHCLCCILGVHSVTLVICSVLQIEDFTLPQGLSINLSIPSLAIQMQLFLRVNIFRNHLCLQTLIKLPLNLDVAGLPSLNMWERYMGRDSIQGRPVTLHILRILDI